MGNFGNKFRKARESKKLSLDDVSNVTKISSRMLRAIEEENFDQLPGGVFNKGFIRTYAKQVGLNSEDAITEYLACVGQAQAELHEGGEPEPRVVSSRSNSANLSATASKTAPKTQSPVEGEPELPGLHLPRVEHLRHKPKEYLDRESLGIPWLTIAIILVIVLAAALIWIRHSRHARTGSKLFAPSVASVEAASPGAPKPPPSQSVPQPVTARVATTDATPYPATSMSQGAAQTPTSTRTTSAATLSSVSSDQPNDASSDTETRRTAAPPAKTASALSLVIRATENSWISVTADGQTVTHETLIAPAHTTVRANREIVVRVGNAAGVTFSWKGEDIPAQGIESEVKTLVFDSEGMHVSVQPSPSPSPQN
jgi:cytoskeleton protein RodZ